MSPAAQRLAAIDNLPAAELCGEAEVALTKLVDVMNRETVLLRTGQWKAAENVTAEKTQLSQDYVTLARAIQRQNPRLQAEAPDYLARLQKLHESFATQMAENLRVLATARTLTEDLLQDVAKAVGKNDRAQTYGNNGAMPEATKPVAGLSINRAL